jgi:hypothetical protein
MSMSIGRLSILVACSISGGAACLDLTPMEVTPPDTGSPEAQQRCRECVYGVNGPAPSCVDEMTRCAQSPACQSAMACSFESSCYGQDRSYALACSTVCHAFVPRVDDPVVVAILLPLYHCLIDGSCAPACVPGQMGVGAPGDAAPTISAVDASAGGACDNARDQAIVSSGLTTTAQSCGLSCFTSATADCHIACVAEQTGLSLACSACWGETIHCGSSSCLQQCLEPASSACSECNARYCAPAFQSCSG